MSDQSTARFAIPSAEPGGMESQRSGHFGRCDCFTLVDLTGNDVGTVSVIDNPPHTDGGCLAPVNLLASHGVNALVVAGIGARPLAGFSDAGIAVFHEAEIPTVGGVIDRLVDGGLPLIDPSAVCGGH